MKVEPHATIHLGDIKFPLENCKKLGHKFELYFLKADGTTEKIEADERTLYSQNWSKMGIGTIGKSFKGDWGGQIHWHGFRTKNLYASGESLDYVAAELYKKYIEEKSFQEEMKNPEKELDYLKKIHDIHFGYSDDHRVWSAGMANLNRIKELEKIVREKQ